MNQPANRPARQVTPPTRAASTFPKAQEKPTDTRSAFSRAKEAAAANFSNLPFISSEGKERLYEAQTALWLHGVRLNTGGKFGERWLLEISEDDQSTDKAAMTFARNDFRDTLFGELANQLSADPTPIGPLQLTKIITQGGQEAWDIIESELPF